ncbi:hypothetical protein P9112_014575 [Eukaryota sp. TZLM1-RC]
MQLRHIILSLPTVIKRHPVFPICTTLFFGILCVFCSKFAKVEEKSLSTFHLDPRLSIDFTVSEPNSTLCRFFDNSLTSILQHCSFNESCQLQGHFTTFSSNVLLLVDEQLENRKFLYSVLSNDRLVFTRNIDLVIAPLNPVVTKYLNRFHFDYSIVFSSGRRLNLAKHFAPSDMFSLVVDRFKALIPRALTISHSPIEGHSIMFNIASFDEKSEVMFAYYLIEYLQALLNVEDPLHRGRELSVTSFFGTVSVLQCFGPFVIIVALLLSQFTGSLKSFILFLFFIFLFFAFRFFTNTFSTIEIILFIPPVLTLQDPAMAVVVGVFSCILSIFIFNPFILIEFLEIIYSTYIGN